MTLVTTQTVVRRYSYTTRFGGIQKLLKVWRVCGVKVWSKVLDQEDYPAWADIQYCCLGSTDWKSKFAEHIKNSS